MYQNMLKRADGSAPIIISDEMNRVEAPTRFLSKNLLGKAEVSVHVAMSQTQSRASLPQLTLPEAHDRLHAASIVLTGVPSRSPSVGTIVRH